MTALALLLLLLSSQSPQNPPPSSSSFSIMGVVVDAVTGAPIPRAELSLFLNNDELTTTAGANGRFRFQNLQPAKYQLYAEARGYLRQGLDQHGAFFTGVAVGSGLDSEHVVFRLHPQAVIYGRVSDEHGEAVRHAIVHVIQRSNGRSPNANSGQFRSQTQTDDLGEFRVAHLVPGKYVIAVQAQPWYAQIGFTGQSEPAQGTFSGLRHTNPRVDPKLDVVYPLTFYPGALNERSATELDLTAGSQVQANIQLQPVPSVHVFLTNLPIQENNRSGINISGTQKAFGSTDLGMAMAMTQIAPGEYEVAGLPPGEIIFTIGDGGKPQDPPHRFSANVSDGNTIDAAASSGPAANLTGRIIPGSPDTHFEQGQLVLVGEDNRSLSAKIQKDGTFSLPSIQSGTYKPLVFVSPRRYLVQKISASGATVRGHDITLDGTHDVQLTITLAPGVGQLTGVAQLSGTPKSGVLVLLEPQSAETFADDMRMDQSDSDGTFTLGEILPGKYFLMAIDGGWDLDWSNPAVLEPFRDQAQILQIAPDESIKVTINVQRSSKNNSH
jgi:hypothetical protein